MEDIIFDEYDEYELQKKTKTRSEKKHRYSTGFRKCALALALAVSVSTGFSAVPGKFDNMETVEAAKKKDNKKPVIKLQGAANLQVTQNESVKIPKVTAKDNVDGNLTKKIKVSVKCGKKSYEDLAKKIQKNKAVVFSKIGKYVVTYTVSDKAKNKATKKRTVTVVAKTEEGKTTETATTQSPTTEQITTVATTTEAPTTEVSTTEKEVIVYPTPADYSKYDIKEYTIDGRKFKITYDESFAEKISNGNPETKEDMANITFKIDNFSYFCLDKKTINGSYDFLKYFGNIKAYDEYGNDVSNSIVFYSSQLKNFGPELQIDCIVFAIYVENSLGKGQLLYFTVSIRDFDNVDEMDTIKKWEYVPVQGDPAVYIKPHGVY